MAQTILVTGGTGYIGGEVIDQLLSRGDTVHTTVRRVAKNEPRLRSRWPDAGGRLKVFQADLMDDAGWAQATAGCDAVAHVASPFPLSEPKDENELIVPARDGALRALKAAHSAGVGRFVQTSSAAAIAYGQPGKSRFDESDWTVVDAPDVAAYPKSKTIAERAAREWVATNAPTMVYCSVNPVAVFGPVENDDLSTSIQVIKMMLEGRFPALPNMGFGVVDVRDVARAHVLALDASAEKMRDERFAVQQRFMWLSDMAKTLRERAPELAHKVPSRTMPDFVVRMLAPFVSDMRTVRTELGKLRDVSGEHARQTLGLEYIPAEQTLEDTARSLVEKGIVKL